MAALQIEQISNIGVVAGVGGGGVWSPSFAEVAAAYAAIARVIELRLQQIETVTMVMMVMMWRWRWRGWRRQGLGMPLPLLLTT